jgi:hypothetical protein
MATSLLILTITTYEVIEGKNVNMPRAIHSLSGCEYHVVSACCIKARHALGTVLQYMHYGQQPLNELVLAPMTLLFYISFIILEGENTLYLRADRLNGTRPPTWSRHVPTQL